jgi:hypothetical protein
MPAPMACTVWAGVKYVSPAFTGIQLTRCSISPESVASRSRSRVRLAESERDRRSRIGRQDVPHLRLAARAVFAIVGVHLHGEPLGSEDQLHQQRQFAIGQIPGFADTLARNRETTAPVASCPRPSRAGKARGEWVYPSHQPAYEFFTTN